MKAIIEECGNGFPSIGDYISGTYGLYKLVKTNGRICTKQWEANYIHAEVEEVEWDECAEEDEFPARVILDDYEPDGELEDDDLDYEAPVESFVSNVSYQDYCDRHTED